MKLVGRKEIIKFVLIRYYENLRRKQFNANQKL